MSVDTTHMRPARLLPGDVMVVDHRPGERWEHATRRYVLTEVPVFAQVAYTRADYHGVIVTFVHGTQRVYSHDEWVEVGRA